MKTPTTTAPTSRLRDVPRYFDQQIANMRAGLARGFSVPRAVLDGRDGSIADGGGAEGPEQRRSMRRSRRCRHDPGGRAGKAARGRRARRSGAVVPAFARLLTFFRSEYVPQARTTLAAEAMPGGKAWYRQQIREYTTLDLSAEQIHQIGLKEVARSAPRWTRSSSRSASAAAGKPASPTSCLPAHRPAVLREDAAGTARPRGVDFQARGRRGRQDHRHPAARPLHHRRRCRRHRAVLDRRPRRPGHLLGQHLRPALAPAVQPAGADPARVLARPRAAGALVQEQGDVPAFRRDYISAYGEGWGLYSEKLGKEMGIYETPYEDFGRLTYEMWRACRLVIDTGVHHKGWTRDQALAYLRDNTALSEHEVTTEVDRYISWPAQALSYKLGEIAIVRLRARGRGRAGPEVRHRAFHDAVLAQGSVPLPVLESQIRAFIAEARRSRRRGSQAPQWGQSRVLRPSRRGFTDQRPQNSL
jgi:hypothetical protein